MAGSCLRRDFLTYKTLWICSSLISTHTDTFMEEGQIPNIIEIWLAHFSIQEYLLSSRVPWSAHFTRDIGHATLAEASLIYLLHICQRRALTHEILKEHPLAIYAAANWWRQVNNMNKDPPNELIERASTLIGDNIHNLLTWTQIYNVDVGWAGPRICDLSITTQDLPLMLYFASMIGSRQVAKSSRFRRECLRWIPWKCTAGSINGR
jgi:hypothetical protein